MQHFISPKIFENALIAVCLNNENSLFVSERDLVESQKNTPLENYFFFATIEPVVINGNPVFHKRVVAPVYPLPIWEAKADVNPTFVSMYKCMCM